MREKNFYNVTKIYM